VTQLNYNAVTDGDILDWDGILIATMTLFVISPHFVPAIFHFIFTVSVLNAVLLFKQAPCCRACGNSLHPGAVLKPPVPAVRVFLFLWFL